jgi:alkylation response protein AidB-like acyl-CoA dehydrogenase
MFRNVLRTRHLRRPVQLHGVSARKTQIYEGTDQIQCLVMARQLLK